jgi:hypothetical protein
VPSSWVANHHSQRTRNWVLTENRLASLKTREVNVLNIRMTSMCSNSNAKNVIDSANLAPLWTGFPGFSRLLVLQAWNAVAQHTNSFTFSGSRSFTLEFRPTNRQNQPNCHIPHKRSRCGAVPLFAGRPFQAVVAITYGQFRRPEKGVLHSHPLCDPGGVQTLLNISASQNTSKSHGGTHNRTAVKRTQIVV